MHLIAEGSGDQVCRKELRAVVHEGALELLGEHELPQSAPGALDPLTRELIYIAVSTANSCSYCVHSHTAAARAKGMTDAQHAELMAIIGLAAQTNHLVNAMQLPIDPEFEVK